MQGNSTANEGKVSHGKLFLPSLAMSYFVAGPLGVLVSLLLVDIGRTFSVSVAVMGQINTPYSIVAVVCALLMGFLSVRFKHKSLLLIGLLFINTSAIGCFLASEYNVMLVFFSLSGLGWAMVSPMVVTLIGEHLPLDKRPNAIALAVAAGAFAYFIGAPIVALIAGVGNWRLALLVFVIPVSLAGLILAFLGLRSTSQTCRPAIDKQDYLRSFKEALSNRSASACLIGDALRSAGFIAILIYGSSFFIERFSASRSVASVILLSAAACYTLGSLSSSRFVIKLGRKPSTVLTAFLAGMFTISYVYITEMWLSVILNLTASWFYGMVVSSANSLTLEQVPKFRGTMMSIDSAAINLGSAIGTVAGGLALSSFDYEGLGSTLGAMSIAAALIFCFLATDPTRT